MMKRDLVKECLPEWQHYMAPAWLGLIRFASSQPEIIERFESDAGMKFRFPGGIEGMVDESTGYREDLVFKFAAWVTENLWGDPHDEQPEREGE